MANEVKIVVKAEDQASSVLGGIGGAFADIGKIAAGVLVSDVIGGLFRGIRDLAGVTYEFGKESILAASRVNELKIVNDVLAKNAGVSADAVQEQVDAVRNMGIEAAIAQGVVASMLRSNLDWTKSSEIARIAQDAAVIAGVNSSEATERIIHGITTMNPLILRNAGLIVDSAAAYEEYAKTLGKKASNLTTAEKQQAFLNATIKAGEGIAGAYTAAMDDPGKVLRSFPRYLDDIKVAFGSAFQNAFKDAIFFAADWTKSIGKALEPSGAFYKILQRLGDIGSKVVGALIDTFGDFAVGLPKMFSDVGKDLFSFVDMFFLQLDRIKILGLDKVLTPALWKNMFGLDEETAQALQSFLNSIINPVKNGLDNLALFWKEQGPAIMETAKEVFDTIIEVGKEVASEILPFLAEQFDKFGLWFQENGPLIQEWTNAAGEVLKWMADTAGTAITDILLPTLDGLISILLELAKVIMQVGLGDWDGAWESMKNIASTATETIKTVLWNFLEMVTGWLGSSGDEFIAIWTNNWEQMHEIAAKIGSIIGKAIKEKFDEIKQTVSDTMQEVQSVVTDKLGAAKGAFDGIISKIKDLIRFFKDLAAAAANFKLPPLLTPGSPTPFEMGLRGINDAMKEINQKSLPAFTGGFGGMNMASEFPAPAMATAGMGGGASISIVYAPQMSFGTAAEFEQNITPLVEKATRKLQGFN